MRVLLKRCLTLISAITLAQPAAAGMFGGESSTTAAAAKAQSTTSSGAAAGAVNDEVVFLQTLQTAQVSSMSCLITLVNMTYNPIGTCLGLITLAEIVVAPADNSSFSDQLGGYLDTVCAGTQCTDADISEAKGQLGETCQGSKDTDLIRVYSAILDNYTNSYRTLACSVHFNGTADNCLPATMNSSQEANNNHFFNDLVTGTNLEQYQSSVFQTAECTGCIYEMYKASVYMISAIRGKDVTQTLGNHLQYDCKDPATVDWSNIQDQQIPDALQIQQSTGSSTANGFRRYVVGLGEGGVGLAVGLILLTGWLIARRV